MAIKKLSIWTIQIGEPLPIKKGVRKQRTSLFCEKAAQKGHNVIRFASAFDHITKKFHTTKDETIHIGENYTLKLFKGFGYKKNISISRMIDHLIITNKMVRYAKLLIKQSKRPDIILVATPPHNLAYRIVRLAKKHKIPVVVDIRDQWPDIFLDWLPHELHGICRLLLYFEFYKIRYALSNCTAMTAMMKDLLFWGLGYSKRNVSVFDKVFYIGTLPISISLPNKINNSKLENIYLECNGKITFVFIGTFNNYYNPSIIVAVANKPWEEGYKEAIFLLAGDGNYYPSIKERAKNVPNVRLLGWLKHEEIMALLSFSNVGLCPLTQDRAVFPNKVFIYFSAFLPIIVSTKGELKDLIDKYKIGCFYEPNDIEGLYNCIKKFIDNPRLIQEMSRNIRRIFWDLFYAGNIYNDFVEHLELIVENTRK